jgi:hypothetical protein
LEKNALTAAGGAVLLFYVAEIALTLLRDVVTQQHAEYEILFFVETVEGLVAETFYDAYARAVTEKEVYATLFCRGFVPAYAAAFQLDAADLRLFDTRGVKHQTAYALFVFVKKV